MQIQVILFMVSIMPVSFFSWWISIGLDNGLAPDTPMPLRNPLVQFTDIEGILPKGPYLPCGRSMVGRALLSGYHRYVVCLKEIICFQFVQWSECLQVSIGSGNGLAPNRHQAIIGSVSQETWAVAGLILGLRPANERQCYFVTTSSIDCVQN